MNQNFERFAEFLPTLLGALVILLVGTGVCAVIALLFFLFLKLIRYDKYVPRFKFRASVILSFVLFMIGMSSVLLLFFNSLGIESLSNAINGMIATVGFLVYGFGFLVYGFGAAIYLVKIVEHHFLK